MRAHASKIAKAAAELTNESSDGLRVRLDYETDRAVRAAIKRILRGRDAIPALAEANGGQR